ncbi:MAG TPA: NYN domain-containing protein [Thermoanaerobaculia bacterium]|jgi:uncharacterized LabA/DUF88 family protein
MPEKVLLFLDGGFVKKKLQTQTKSFPATRDIIGLCTMIMGKPRLQGKELLRVYYYDAPPLDGTTTNPLDGSTVNFSSTPQAAKNRSLIDSLELEPDFAVRRGMLAQNGWKLGKSALRNLTKNGGTITANDLVPDISQKGVDIKIGLDVASMALKRFADIFVLVTGDSDFVPPMKFARKEGVRVYLECLGHPVKRELKAHADLVL